MKAACIPNVSTVLMFLLLSGHSVFGQQAATNIPAVPTPLPHTIAITNAVTVRPDTPTQALIQQVAERNRWLDTFMPALLGGFLAALGGILVAYWAHKLERGRERERDQTFQANLLRALRSELETVGDVYGASMGRAIEELTGDAPLMVRFVISDRWFPVFDANVAHVGRLDDTGTARAIVRTYALIRKLIDQLRVNNYYLEQLWELAYPPAATTAVIERINTRRENLERNLRAHSPGIRAAHNEVMQATGALLTLLEKSTPPRLVSNATER